MTVQWPGLFFIAWGLYVFLTSLSGPEGYKRNYKSGSVAAIIGQKGARVFFIGMGGVIIILGLCVLFTILDANDDAIKFTIGGSK